jgi:hypothetical protein
MAMMLDNEEIPPNFTKSFPIIQSLDSEDYIENALVLGAHNTRPQESYKML